MKPENRELAWQTLKAAGTPWPNSQHSLFVQSDGIIWHVQQWIAVDKPTAVLLHGTGSSSHSWAQLAPLLANDFSVLCIDLPGHGFTENGSRHQSSLTGMAQTVATVLDHLKLAPSLIIGHSAGAAIAIEMSIQCLINPTAIISINGALLPLTTATTALFSPLAKLLAANPFVPHLFSWQAGRAKPVKQLLQSTGSTIDQRSIDCYTQLVANPQHVKGALAMMANWDLASFETRLARLKKPLHLIVCNADKTVPPRQSLQIHNQLAQMSTLKTIPNLGHLGHEENPSLFADIITTIARDH